MEAMRDSWTDARLDDFARNTERRFDSVERRMETGFAEMNTRFAEMNARFDAMNARFDSLQRTLLRLGGALLVAVLVALIGAQL
jgi:flagellar capping protein FliD